MGRVASQITSLTIVYTTVYSDADQSKHQSSASLAFVWGIHRDREFPAQRASYAENVSIWWRHHGLLPVATTHGICESSHNFHHFHFNLIFVMRKKKIQICWVAILSFRIWEEIFHTPRRYRIMWYLCWVSLLWKTPCLNEWEINKQTNFSIAYIYAYQLTIERSSNILPRGTILDNKVHGANMGPIWDRQDPGGPHVCPMNFSIWDIAIKTPYW